MRSNFTEFRTHVIEFALFLFAVLVAWGDADLCRYLILHKKPTEHDFLWVVALYSVLWIVGSLLRDPLSSLYGRIRSLELDQPPIEQQPES